MDKPRISNESLAEWAKYAEAWLRGEPLPNIARQSQFVGHLILDLLDARRRIAELEARYKWRPISEAHEDHGPCVYIDIQDPGSQCIAHVCDVNYAEDIEGMTHFAQLPELTQEMAQDLIAAQRQKEGE